MTKIVQMILGLKSGLIGCLTRLVRPRWRKRHRKLVPPIETHGCATFWFKHGCPEKIGSEIVVSMQSGRRAIFRLTKVKYNWDVDWNWYTFEFVDYLTND